MHLALSRLEKLRAPEADAHRLFLADGLLKNGIPADEIVIAVEMGPAAFERLHKYSADQPRVPAGSGRPSGQWTSGGAPGSPAEDAGSASGASGGASDANGRTGDPLQPGLGSTEGEVNPNTVTPAGGFIRGDDACHLAMKDCVKNHIEDTIASNDNLSEVAYKACTMSELACDFAALSVEKTPNLRAWFVFPDGGVVHMLGGFEMIYTPTTRRGRNRFR